MNVMKVLPQLSLSKSGPVNEQNATVHFRQGDLDGACGPYCLVMALVANGVLSAEDVMYNSQKEKDKRTALGKFKSRLNELGTFVTSGTDHHEVINLAESYKGQISAQYHSGTTREMVDILKKMIDQGHACIVGVDWKGGDGHWLLVVGYQGRIIDLGSDGEELECTHLLCLDSLVESPKVSLWNTVLEVKTPQGQVANLGPYPTNYWDGTETTPCKIFGATSIVRRT